MVVFSLPRTRARVFGIIRVGKTAVEIGTTVYVAEQSYLASGYEVVAPETAPADGVYAVFTISGERTLSGLSSIVNNSLQHHVLAFPIDASAATPTLPLANENYLVFSGGIALTTMPSINDMRLAGVWNLTGVWDEPPPGTSIMSGSTVNVSGTLDKGYNIVINANATLNVAEVKAPHGDSPKNRFLYKNAGTFNVTGEMLDTIASSAATAYSLAGAFAKGDAKAVTRTKGLVHSGSTKSNHQYRSSHHTCT